MDKTCLVGIGSPHGNDAIGWRVVEGLRNELPASVHVRTLAEPTALLPLLGQHERVWIVDACRSPRPAGTVVRLTWPEERVDRRWTLSGHGVGLAEVLDLATTLGRVAEKVIVYTIDIGHQPSRPGDRLSCEVAAACDELQKCLRAEIEASEENGPGILTTVGLVGNDDGER